MHGAVDARVLVWQSVRSNTLNVLYVTVEAGPQGGAGATCIWLVGEL